MRRLLPLLFLLFLLFLLLLPAAAQAHDVVRITSEPSTTGVWVFAPTPEQLAGVTDIEIVSDGQARSVGVSDFLESLRTRGVVYVAWVGTVEDPDHPPLVIPTYPPATAELLIHRDNTRFCPGADVQPAPNNLPLMRSATLCLINLERKARGMRPLRIHPLLQKTSQSWARTMVRKHFFSHNDRRGGSGERMRRVGYLRDDLRDFAASENIAAGPEDGGQPRFIVAAWMRSEGHRENMLEPLFRDIGVGIMPSTTRGTPGATYVTDFGRRWFWKRPSKRPSRATAK